MTAIAVVPVFDEHAAISDLVTSLLAGPFAGVVVVDGGSSDGTADIARAAGATVVVERGRGYGRAMMCGHAVARDMTPTHITFMDGNGTLSAAHAAAVLAPARDDGADVVVGCRNRDGLRLLQRVGNRLATEVIARTHGVRYRDIGSIRTVRANAFDALELSELTYGWPLQLQIRAAALGLRVAQVNLTLHPRRSRSKVSGTLRGRAGAAAAMLRVLGTHCVVPR